MHVFDLFWWFHFQLQPGCFCSKNRIQMWVGWWTDARTYSPQKKTHCRQLYLSSVWCSLKSIQISCVVRVEHYQLNISQNLYNAITSPPSCIGLFTRRTCMLCNKASDLLVGVPIVAILGAESAVRDMCRDFFKDIPLWKTVEKNRLSLRVLDYEWEYGR